MGDDLYSGERFMPPAMTYCTTCLGRKGLLSCPAIPAAARILLNVRKTPTSPKSRKEGRGQYDSSLVYTVLDSHPAFFLPIATTSNKNFLKVQKL